MPLRLAVDGAELAFFSTIATFGTAVDITLAELAIEAFFPADEATARLPAADADQRASSSARAGVGEHLEAHRVGVVALLAQHACAAVDARRELEAQDLVGRQRPLDVATHIPPGPRSTVRPLIGDPLRRCSVHAISIWTRG